MSEASSNSPITLRPIGWVRSPYRRRFGTPQQAAAVDSDAEAVLELSDEMPEASLSDLEGMERIWVLSWLDRGGTWAPLVRPPRGRRIKRGLFATRSPDRPNPIGLSAVRLVRIEGRRLYVRGIDLLDGTPILDLKPYVAYADAFPDAKSGWIDEIPRDAPQLARYVADPE
ncbi:MAG: tRNA (N6-threonylcarbamoyladenosine(37)-N6)-methyltransferase TrmO [Deltaproteobacteria bacterium]|nr:tRNA (N6-threonylcarbamoyladenosine(37)-N6)-methyltransferase TrmO [Deltaproteobacteria bacterium]